MSDCLHGVNYIKEILHKTLSLLTWLWVQLQLSGKVSRFPSGPVGNLIFDMPNITNMQQHTYQL